MANNTSGASLSGIYDRLANAPVYRPFEANTFADWSVEAGDMITMSMDGTEYSAPLHSTRMTWKGAPQITMSSTGSKEREPVSKVSRKKYGRGGSAVRGEESLYREFTSSDGLLHSAIYMSESRMYVHFDDELSDVHSQISETASEIYATVYSTSHQLQSYIDMTACNINMGVSNAISQTYSYVDMTASTINIGVTNALSQTYSYIDATASTINIGVTNALSQTYSYIDATASDINLGVVNAICGVYSNIQVTADGIRSDVRNSNCAMYSYIDQKADRITQNVANIANGLQSSIDQQADRINLIVEGTGANEHIKPAQIQAAIDAASGLSKIVLSANHIILDGDAVAQSLHGEDIMVATLNAADAEFTSSLQVLGDIRTPDKVICGNLDCDTAVTINGHDVKVYNVVKSQDESTLTIYYTDGTSTTFRKAASIDALTGSWGGIRLVVTTDPSSEHTYTVGFPSSGSYPYDQNLHVEWYNTASASIDGLNISIPYKVTANGENTSGQIVSVGSITAENVLDNTYATAVTAITSNGEYIPAQGKIGFNKIVVDVAGTDPTQLETGWEGSGTYKVKVTPQGIERSTTLRSISPTGDITVNGTTVTRKFNVQYGEAEGPWINTGFSQNVSIDASQVFRNGVAEGKSAMGVAADTVNHTVKVVEGSTSSLGISCEKVSMTYVAANHYYAYVFQSKAGESVVATISGVSDTDAFNAGYDDAKDKISYPSVASAGEKQEFTLLVPNAARTGQDTVTFRMNKGTPATSGYASVTLVGVGVVGRIDISNWYTSGWDDGYDQAADYVHWPNLGEGTQFYIDYPNSDRSGYLTKTFQITKDPTPGSTGYVKVGMVGKGTVGQISIGNWYDAGAIYGLQHVSITGFDIAYQSGTSDEYKAKVKLTGTYNGEQIYDTWYESSWNMHATNAYNNGWSGSYNAITISPSVDTTVNPGSSVTVRAYGKSSSGATATEKASVKISAPTVNISASIYSAQSGDTANVLLSPGQWAKATGSYVNASGQTVSISSYKLIKADTDANLIAGNIKKDVRIFGVTGTYEGGSASPTGVTMGSRVTNGKYNVTVSLSDSTTWATTTKCSSIAKYWYELGGGNAAPFVTSSSSGEWSSRKTTITSNGTYYVRARYKSYSIGSGDGSDDSTAYGPYASNSYANATLTVNIPQDHTTKFTFYCTASNYIGGSYQHMGYFQTSSLWNTGTHTFYQ